MAEKVVISEVQIPVSAPGADQVPPKLSRIAAELKKLNQAGQAAGITGDSGIVGLLRGGGIAAAVGFGASAVRGVIEAVREIQKGQLTASESLVKLTESVPILSQIVQLGTAMGEAFAGTADAVERINKDIARGEILMLLREQNAAANKQFREGVNSRIRGNQRAAGATGLKGFAAEIFGLNADASADSEDAAKGLQDFIDERRKRDAKAIALLQSQLSGIKVPSATVVAGGPAPGIIDSTARDAAIAQRSLILKNIQRINEAQARDVAKAQADAEREQRSRDARQQAARGDIAKRRGEAVDEMGFETRQTVLRTLGRELQADFEKLSRDAMKAFKEAQTEEEKNAVVGLFTAQQQQAIRKSMAESMGDAIKGSGKILPFLFGAGRSPDLPGPSFPSPASLVESREARGILPPVIPPAVAAAEQTAKNTSGMKTAIDDLKATVSDLSQKFTTLLGKLATTAEQ